MSVSAVWQIKVYSSHSDSEHSLLSNNYYTCPQMEFLQCTLHLRVLPDFLTPSSIYFLLLVNALFSYLTKKTTNKKPWFELIACLHSFIQSTEGLTLPSAKYQYFIWRNKNRLGPSTFKHSEISGKIHM